MKPHDVRSDISSILDLLANNELALLTNPTVVEHDGNTQLVTFRSHLGYNFEIQRDFTTVGEYRRIVLSGCYCAMLVDGSVLQASYKFRHSKLVKHRLAFYPCPFDLEEEDIRYFGIEDLVELMASGRNLSDVFLRSPIRFDYSSRDAREGHPASHLTLNSPHCRISVSAPVSFGHFARLIFQHFYPRMWASYDWLRETAVRRLNREITRVDERGPHLELGLGKDASLISESDYS